MRPQKLQDAFATSGVSTGSIDLPQICVVGSQSSGKSSVLENVVVSRAVVYPRLRRLGRAV